MLYNHYMPISRYKGFLKSKIEKYTHRAISSSPDPTVLVPAGPVTAPSGEESSRSDPVITPALVPAGPVTPTTALVPAGLVTPTTALAPAGLVTPTTALVP